MKSKSDILSLIVGAMGNSSCNRSCSPSDMQDDKCKCDREILQLLDQYASQVSVGFAEWLDAEREKDANFDMGLSYTDLFTQYLKTIEQ